jgi:hypothetical protein
MNNGSGAFLTIAAERPATWDEKLLLESYAQLGPEKVTAGGEAAMQVGGR